MPLTEKFTIRDAAPTDADALALVASASFLEAFAGLIAGEDILLHCRNQHSVAKYTGWLARSGAHFALAEVEDAPVGYAMLSEPDLPMELRPDDMELKRIYALHRFQGTGAGRALLEWAIKRAGVLGSHRLLLGVNTGNDRALGFYRRNGFVECGTRKFQVGTATHDDLLLCREI